MLQHCLRAHILGHLLTPTTVEIVAKTEPAPAVPPAAPTSVPEPSNAHGGSTSPAKPNAGADSATVGPGDTSPRGTAPVPGPEEPPKPGPPLRNTEIRFYKNGVSQGPVFVDMLPAGTRSSHLRGEITTWR
jgi:hypothetical protein